jgi:hypothetical protein
MAEIRLREPLAGADTALLERCVNDSAAWQALPKLGEARRSSVARMQLSAGPTVVKRYSEPAGFRLLTFARRSRAEREARALDLAAAAVPDGVIRVLGWGEERRLGCVEWSLLVTAELERSFDLRRIKTLAGRERSDAVRAVQDRLPQLVARLHAGRVFAATLRGKNVLLQPATGRIALIDLPYARAVSRFGTRHRERDLAILSLELSRFLSGAEWQDFLARYRAAARELGARDTEIVNAERIARVAARVGHRTKASSARKRLRSRFRRTRIGEWMTGHRYARPGGERD